MASSKISAPARRIPLQRPCTGRAEASAAAAAVLAQDLVGRGTTGLELEKRMAHDLGVRHLQLTTSGTHALELSTAVLGLGPGDEVILPSFTFSSVANCVLRQGAKPVFADVKLDDLNLDPEDVARRVTKRTRAVIAVHYAGASSDLAALQRLAKDKGLALIEDAAHSVGASWRGRALGTIGDAGCMSFHATKNITCGEGGAFMTNSDVLARRAECFREKGTNRSAFLRGEIKKYTWVSEGSSYVLSDVLAAILGEQWKRREQINAERGRLYKLYMEKLSDLERSGYLRLPRISAEGRSSWHLFHVLLPNRRRRDRCLDGLKAKGIGAAFHYQPLHASPFARKTLGCRDRLPVSERAGETLMRLPLFAGLRTEEVDYICAALRGILTRRPS
ncbi:MAG TPA: dTDP-4-amino-4,6-dideoxygalactose transaminase [Elusimicrobiota bacterium]|nr:dTDP-4-amino-4,6-dideoxygalactose transaminase [Elusimicrobiota bacterium]